MKKTICLISLLFAFSVSAYCQKAIIKNCKTCGKPIKECQYKGKHPSKTSKAIKNQATLDMATLDMAVNKLIQIAIKTETGFWIGIFPGFVVFIDGTSGSMYYGEFDDQGIPTGIITSVLYDLKKIEGGEYWNDCKGTIFHVGEWKNGKVSGLGSCYDKNGKLIYRGIFVNDRPTGKYPMTDNSSSHFDAVEYFNGDMYIGERRIGRYGLGIYIWKDGSCLYAKWGEDGMPNGMEVYISASGVITETPTVLGYTLDGVDNVAE